jgi:hypothetical protein
MWCVAELDRNYIEGIEDIQGGYERPYQADEPVVCLAEKAITLHADVRPLRLMKPGKPRRPDNECKRCGVPACLG